MNVSSRCFLISISLTVILGCGAAGDARRHNSDSAVSGRSGRSLAAEVMRACSGADSVLQLLAGSVRTMDSTYDFGANFRNDPRAGCQVTFSGLARGGPAIGDSIVTLWQTRGWRFATRYQADGIGDNLTGMHIGSTLCLLNNHLDMKDEGDDGPVMRSDSIDVSISCTKLSPSDTLEIPSS